MRVALGANRSNDHSSTAYRKRAAGSFRRCDWEYCSHFGARVSSRPNCLTAFRDCRKPAIDTTVLVFTLAVSLLTGLIFGLAPAFRLRAQILSRVEGRRPWHFRAPPEAS